MKRKIVVEITANKETCGGCVFAEPYRGCWAFRGERELVGGRPTRLPECKQAEVKK
jgi:hypothetical protein